MISNAQVLFRGIEYSGAVEEAVQKRLEKLERYSDKIQSLKVILEAPHNNHHKGRVYHVGVEALMPNHESLLPMTTTTIMPMKTSMWRSVMPSMPWSGV